jgi:RPA family protein
VINPKIHVFKQHQIAHIKQRSVRPPTSVQNRGKAWTFQPNETNIFTELRDEASIEPFANFFCLQIYEQFKDHLMAILQLLAF